MNKEMNTETDAVTFAAGCFRCIEEQFKRLEHRHRCIPGYAGDTVANPDDKFFKPTMRNGRKYCQTIIVLW